MEKLTNFKNRKKKKKKNSLRLRLFINGTYRIFAEDFRALARKKSKRMTVSKERDTEGRPYRTLKILFFVYFLHLD